MSRFLVVAIMLIFGAFLFSMIYGENSLFEAAKELHIQQVGMEQQIP